MRTTLLVALLLTLLTPEGAWAQAQGNGILELKEIAKKTKQDLSNSKQFSEVVQALMSYRTSITEFRTSLKGKAKGSQLRDVFIAGLQIDSINTLSPETLDKSNCTERLLKLQSDTSGALFSDGEFSEDLLWISEGVVKLCPQSQATSNVQGPRTPAENKGQTVSPARK